MNRWLCTLLLAACSLTAVAAPDRAPADDMNKLLADKGLRAQLEGARQTVATTAHTVADQASELVLTSMGFLGVPYKRGGNSFEGGFDCSGFVRAIYEQTLGFILPRRANEQAAATQAIDKQQLRPGDLVFFNTMRRAFSHVGIYVGDHKFIHSPRSGGEIRVEDMRVSYWSKRFNGARRVAALEEPNAQTPNNLSASDFYGPPAPNATPAASVLP
jgi:cell wall-associated NlpC family hydrolase